MSLRKAALFTLGVLLFGCGSSGENARMGGVTLGVGTNPLLETQHLCFTWTLYRPDPVNAGAWLVTDKSSKEVCAKNGLDKAQDFAICHSGEKFLIVYTIDIYQDDVTGSIARQSATSGGGANDICNENTDAASYATVQWDNHGDVGGVNPGIVLDNICYNDELEIRDDMTEDDAAVVSALWLQPKNCAAGSPDRICALASGSGVSTARWELSADERVQLVFNTSSRSADWDIWYLAFDYQLPPEQLHVFNSPWVLHHQYDTNLSPKLQRGGIGARGSWYYNHEGVISVGFVSLIDGNPTVVYDQTGSCAVSMDVGAVTEQLPLQMECPLPDVLGITPTGPTTFNVVMSCGSPESDLYLVTCDVSLPSDICGRPTE